MKRINLKKDLTKDNRLERIWLLAKIEFKLRYNENKLGLIWAFLNPLLQLGTYFIAFSVILTNKIENFALYLFTGLVVYRFFIEATTGLIVILKTKKYLYEYSNMSKVEIYLASLISVSLGFFFNLSMLIIILMIAGINVGFSVLFIPLLFIILFGLSLGGSMILSIFFLIVKDIKQVWAIVSHLLLYLSAIFFSAELIKDKIPIIDFLNPMFGMIINFRKIIMYNEPPDWGLVIINICQATLLLFIGLLLLKKVGKKASEML